MCAWANESRLLAAVWPMPQLSLGLQLLGVSVRERAESLVGHLPGRAALGWHLSG